MGDAVASVTTRARTIDADLSERPVTAALHAVAGALYEIGGPMFWAALIVLFLQAEFLID